MINTMIMLEPGWVRLGEIEKGQQLRLWLHVRDINYHATTTLSVVTDCRSNEYEFSQCRLLWAACYRQTGTCRCQYHHRPLSLWPRSLGLGPSHYYSSEKGQGPVTAATGACGITTLHSHRPLGPVASLHLRQRSVGGGGECMVFSAGFVSLSISCAWLCLSILIIIYLGLGYIERQRGAVDWKNDKNVLKTYTPPTPNLRPSGKWP